MPFTDSLDSCKPSEGDVVQVLWFVRSVTTRQHMSVEGGHGNFM